ncbi:hypothetical protein [Chryseobacterium sp. FH1]|uniref:hypothetical protein n=1 Tax=Chryseobacterium sp. FH1 TaxID=1233951 RepID=UPI0004E2B219|nr:hypothetical protein [Chryseobacterium sp. FH1]KFC18790.1 hypothetical protein IO90_17525 [Chryseobacterium sp. FH1]
MKKLSILFSIFLIVLIKSQSVSDYKYIVIPSEFADFKGSKSFGLTAIIEKSLKNKKYVVLSESKSDWPSEALQNPCGILNTDLSDDSNMFKNRVILQFKDCDNKVVLSQKANSSIKDFEPGYQEAVKNALVFVSASNPNLQKLAETKPVETKPQEEIKTVESKTGTTSAQKFSNGKMNFQKIQIDNSQFILVDGNSSVPFATFKSTTKADVFRVKLSSGESTIGYYENGNIVIELPKTNGEYSKEIYKAN